MKVENKTLQDIKKGGQGVERDNGLDKGDICQKQELRKMM